MGRDRIIFTSSSEEMIEVGKLVGATLSPNSVLALSGDLGAGKTTFVQGVAQGLLINIPIQSPTFIYLNRYTGKLPLFHFDLYRIKGEDDFFGLGFDEYFEAGGVCAIEWPERIPLLLPKNTLHILFSHQDKGRTLVFSEMVIGLSRYQMVN